MIIDKFFLIRYAAALELAWYSFAPIYHVCRRVEDSDSGPGEYYNADHSHRSEPSSRAHVASYNGEGYGGRYDRDADEYGYDVKRPRLDSS